MQVETETIDGSSGGLYSRLITRKYQTTGDAGSTCPSPASVESFTYDLDGNLTVDATYTYEWDAENRLILVAPASLPASGGKKLEFAYDYLPLTRVRRSLGVASRHVPHGGTRRVKGRRRRVQKRVYEYASGDWSQVSDQRFVWDG